MVLKRTTNGKKTYHDMESRVIELYYEPRQQCHSEYEWPEDEPEMTVFESAFLCGMIKQKKPHKIVEVGIAAGGTTAIILKCIELLGLADDCEVYSVDLSERFYRGQGKRSGYLADDLLKQNEPKFRHSFMLGRLLPEVIDEIGNNIDFVILDTAHAMPGELLDFLTVFPYLKSGATVYRLASSHYESYLKHFEHHYGKSMASLFSAIYEMQNNTYITMQEQKVDYKRKVKMMIRNSKTYLVG